MTPPLNPNRNELKKLARAKMPFGKFKGRYLSDLPEAYLVWFRRQGFPRGTLGRQMAAVLDLKTNDLDHLLRQIRDLL